METDILVPCFMQRYTRIGRFNPDACFGENGTRQAGFRAYAAGELHEGGSLTGKRIGKGIRMQNKSTRMGLEQTGKYLLYEQRIPL